MLLNNEFVVDAGIDETWHLLTDLERVVTCMPGASIRGREGDEYVGAVKVKVGAIGANIEGRAHFTELDEVAKQARIAAAGKDPKGQAAAKAQIQARLEGESANRTRVLIDTDLDISGRMAQFGRGAIADVSNRLMGQFSDNLGQKMLDNTSEGGAPNSSEPQSSSTVRCTEPNAASSPGLLDQGDRRATGSSGGGSSAEVDGVSLLWTVLKDRYGQALAGGLIGVLVSWLVWGRRVE